MLLIERRSARDVNVHLELRRLVNEIRDPSLAHGAAQRSLVNVELRREGGDECWNVRLAKSRDQVDTHRRSRLTRDGARNRPAGCAERVQRVSCEQCNCNRVCRGHASSSASISG
jgi:hypothetical protein